MSTPTEKILTPTEKISTNPEKISTPPENISTPLKFLNPTKFSQPPTSEIFQIFPPPPRKFLALPRPRKLLNPPPPPKISQVPLKISEPPKNMLIIWRSLPWLVTYKV